ncbi:dihydroneopterin triphosphate diphosphatase [Candidatus Berkiella aquae]|uniref:Dihydroneopterin triphosphate diphosphatase n=1 Tax=Candidatus Berkiella aquae TaxID=295108 RepID=A0A0Q9YQY0_9GAMM|nr:dihydroneopterin triphosphate diphosphatase [Candidatus Berkiella aquae]MCS5712486.1 dihydroneopterin triphosphate diphosphatase [Candidatus Berkiella aquae]
MTKRPESVLVIVFTPQADVLLLQRADYPSFWQSVTGSLEADEMPLEAAWRELKEETALGIENGIMKDCHLANWFEIYPQWRHRYAPSVTQNKEHVFTFEIPKIIPITLSHEHIGYRWLDNNQAYQLASSPSNQEAIKTLIKGNE